MYSNDEISKKPMPENLDELIQKEYVNVGQRLRTIRIRKGISQSDLAAKVGMVGNYVSNIESARVHTSISRLTKLAIALDVSLQDFFSDPEADKNEFDVSDISVEKLVAIAKLLKKNKEI